MTDTARLREAIARSGLKLCHLANEIGITRQQLSKKIENRVPFNQYEIDGLCRTLNIKSLREKDAIFFAKNVD